MRKIGIKNGLLLLATVMGLLLVQPVYAQNLLNDPSFEGGTPNAEWFEASINLGTPLCDIPECGTGGGTSIPRTGDWWAWFGGFSGYEEGEVNQSVVIPNGTATLSFWLFLSARSGNDLDYLQVEIDGNTVFTVLEDDLNFDPYAQVVIDVSAYADGNVHNIRFYSEIFGPTTTNFAVDDVELLVNPDPVIPLKSWSIILALGLITMVILFQFIKLK